MSGHISHLTVFDVGVRLTFLSINREHTFETIQYRFVTWNAHNGRQLTVDIVSAENVIRHARRFDIIICGGTYMFVYTLRKQWEIVMCNQLYPMWDSNEHAYVTTKCQGVICANEEKYFCVDVCANMEYNYVRVWSILLKNNL